MRLIDADAFDKALKNAQNQCRKTGGNFKFGFLSTVRANLEAAPTIDAVPVVYGYWEDEPDRGRHWHCSECGTVQGISCVAMNYCPHCGAKMAEHPWAASGCGQTFSPD